MGFTHTRARARAHTHTHTLSLSLSLSKFTVSYNPAQDETTSPIILHHNPEGQSMDVKPLSYL